MALVWVYLSTTLWELIYQRTRIEVDCCEWKCFVNNLSTFALSGQWNDLPPSEYSFINHFAFFSLSLTRLGWSLFNIAALKLIAKTQIDCTLFLARLPRYRTSRASSDWSNLTTVGIFEIAHRHHPQNCDQQECKEIDSTRYFTSQKDNDGG